MYLYLPGDCKRPALRITVHGAAAFIVRLAQAAVNFGIRPSVVFHELIEALAQSKQLAICWTCDRELGPNATPLLKVSGETIDQAIELAGWRETQRLDEVLLAQIFYAVVWRRPMDSEKVRQLERVNAVQQTPSYQDLPPHLRERLDQFRGLSMTHAQYRAACNFLRECTAGQPPEDRLVGASSATFNDLVERWRRDEAEQASRAVCHSV